MGTLLLCKDKIAASPYYIEETSLNVYTLAELSYFIANNTYLLNSSFMTVDLVTWIARELEMKDLSESLFDLLKSAAPLHIFIGHILSAGGYLSIKEQKDVLDIIESFEDKSEVECRKLRADRLMDRGRIVDAIYEYEKLLSDDAAMASNTLVGDVYHNLGCAYGKLFFFDEAINCFDEAYKRNRRNASLMCLLGACKCARDNDAFTRMCGRYQVLKENVDAINSTISEITASDAIKEFGEKVKAGLSEEETFAIVTAWKDKYNQYAKI